MQITQLFIYPVKSLSGISVEKAMLTQRGFQYDRRWMIIDRDGLFISQRTSPTLSQIKVVVKEESLHLYSKADAKGVQIPLKPKDGQPDVKVEVWGTVCRAIGGFESANIWLRNQLSIDYRLVYMPNETKRLINSPLVPEGSVVSFADGYPYLLIGTASLNDLNGRLENKVGIERFRPNIVIQTNTPFEEDTWATFQMGAFSFIGVKSCSRCVMVNVNQTTATAGKEPLKTLATYRKEGNKVLFGQNVLWNNNSPTTERLVPIRIGDEINNIVKKNSLPNHVHND